MHCHGKCTLGLVEPLLLVSNQDDTVAVGSSRCSCSVGLRNLQPHSPPPDLLGALEALLTMLQKTLTMEGAGATASGREGASGLPQPSERDQLQVRSCCCIDVVGNVILPVWCNPFLWWPEWSPCPNAPHLTAVTMLLCKVCSMLLCSAVFKCIAVHNAPDVAMPHVCAWEIDHNSSKRYWQKC